MPITTKSIVDQLNNKIVDPNLTFDETNQIATVVSLISAVNNAVDTESDLPTAVSNTGRLIFVKSIASYRYSNGVNWQPISKSIPNPTITLWAWGLNSSGQLGDNSITPRSSPASVVGGFTDWCQISAGSSHTAAVRTNGTLWTWGNNGSGQLGDNTTTARSSPVSVVGGFTDWCQVSASYVHTAAVRTNGTLWTWGSNYYGQLGDNSATGRSSPVSVVGGFADWCQVSAGGAHTAAIRTNGTLWAWGKNNYGQLGDNTTVSKSSPVSVVGGFTDWCQVSSGSRHTAAVRTNGSLWSWGSNNSGRLGQNISITCSMSSPASVAGGFTDWCQVSAGYQHAIAVRTNGTLWSWGSNSSGQLGDNSATYKTSPVSVVGGFTDWCQVSASNAHTAAIRTNGTLWTWGNNSSGRLGDNTTADRSSPVSVVGGFTDWGRVSAGDSHTVGIRSV